MNPSWIALYVALLITGCAGPIPSPDYTGKKGSQKPYKIDGKWYYPVASAHNYEEEGIASWYGKDFHGKKTANGETYNMHAMTGAHKTLPLGTYVRVTRLDDGKETVVRINDRGPFVKERIIDLSYKAAGELGVDRTGTARVRIAALGDLVGDRLVTRDYQRGSFSVQVGAFTVRENAERLRHGLSARYRSVAVSTFDRGDTVFYRVRIGGMTTIKEAEEMKNRVEGKEVETAFVVAD